MYEIAMALPPPPMTMAQYRELAREVRRLARILQATMSLEGQGLDVRELHQIKIKIALRLLQVS